MSDPDTKSARAVIGSIVNGPQATDEIERLRFRVAGLQRAAMQGQEMAKEQMDRCVAAEKERDSLRKALFELDDLTIAHREASSLRKALDDRHEADRRAWRDIMQATGRERGVPNNKEVVAYLIAEVERLEKALSYSNECFNECAANEVDIRAENRTLREALDNATSRARMNDSDGAQISVDNFHLKNGRAALSATANSEKKP